MSSSASSSARHTHARSLPSTILLIISTAAIIPPLDFSFHSYHAFAFDNFLLHGYPRTHQYSYRARLSSILSDTSLRALNQSKILSHDEGRNGVVSVCTKRTLPDVTPQEARNAWMEYHWKKGGGLPIFVLPTKPQRHDELATDSGVDDILQQSSGDLLERTILPISMRERLERHEALLDDEKSRLLDLHYSVTESGPFFADLKPGSHSAVVTFETTTTYGKNSSECLAPGCVMTWNVTFSTARWSSFYGAVTKWTVGTAATTILEATAVPRLFSARTMISDDNGCVPDPESARRECLDFVFAEGGGLPLPPPIPYGDVLGEGGGAARRNLLRLPPLIVESVVDARASDGMAEFAYRLDGPGWQTFPFLLHTHAGCVRFASSPLGLVVEWDVEVRPYRLTSQAVEGLIEATVSTLLRNLRVRLTQPGAKVVVRPPRGNSNALMGRQGLVRVAKETWIGGVLDAHLLDTRPVMEQTMALFRPWRWGRSGTGNGSDYVQFLWTNGRIELHPE